MSTPSTGSLRDKAVAAVAKGNFVKAIAYYSQLAGIQPNDGAWPRKKAEIYRSMDQTALAVEAYQKASKIYAEDGFLVKAVAMCKIILRIDPDNREAQEQLVAFNSARGISAPATKKAPKVGGTMPPTSAMEVDAPLGSIELAHAPIATVEREIEGEPSGVVEIFLDDEDFGDTSLDAVPDAAATTLALAHTPLFSALSPQSLHSLIDKVRLVEVAAGDFVFREGDSETTLYVVCEGRLAAFRGPSKLSLGELKDGDFFGEVSLVINQPRGATVRAIVDSELLAIDREVLGQLIAKEPQVLVVLFRFLRERLIDNLMKTSPLFSPFGGEERDRLIRRFQFLEVAAGTSLLREGQPASALFVVMAGSLEVTRLKEGIPQQLVILGRGDVFGEMSLLARAGAAASVTARSKCLVLELPAKAFREVIMTHPQVLVFVGELAEERRRQLSAVAEGEEKYEELHLDLF